MLHVISKRFEKSVSADEKHLAMQEKFNELCVWIEAHLNEPLGWQELIGRSGWDYQTIQTLFYRNKCTTAMTWIRLRRTAKALEEAHPSVIDMRLYSMSQSLSKKS